jgi:hypothetical protein
MSAMTAPEQSDSGQGEDLARDAELAGYDLETDLAQPVPHQHDVAGFDLDLDILADNEPPDLRR